MKEVNIWDAIIDATIKTLLKQKQELISGIVEKLETLKNLHNPGSLTNRKINKLIEEYEAKLK